MSTKANKMLTAALAYAELGFAVFPLMVGDKVPLGRLAPNGFKDATTDTKRIEGYWQAEPNANIGIACGSMSGGLCVLDIDTHNADGKEALRQWLAENSMSMPETVTAISGGGGNHYYFRSTVPMKSRAGILSGIDIKSDGGYIVAPPSIHPSGTPYTWANGKALGEIQTAPVEALPLLSAAAVQSTAENKKTSKCKDKIPSGERNNTLASHLGNLRNKGWDVESLEAEALRFNRDKMLEPLNEAEVIKVAQSIAAYPPAYYALGQHEKAVDIFLLDRLTELHPEESGRYKNTELGWGNLYAEVFKDEARFCPERKAWFIYDGIRWKHEPQSLGAIERAKRLADALLIYLTRLPEAGRTELLKGWSAWQKRGVRDNVLRDAASVYPISIKDFDKNPYLLNVQNGTLNLKTGVLQPHSADDLITKLAPVTFDPQASCPRWDKFIGEIMRGDIDTARCLMQCLGYSLTGSTELEKMFILYGVTSRNGKSTLAETVLGVLGDYAATANPEMFSTGRNTAGGMKATEDLARLDGIRFVNISEPPKGMSLNAARVKQWTGSDKVNARYLNENSFDYKPQFKFFLNTNDLPVISDMALFKSGRIVVIPFNRHFTEAEQDITLKQKFATDEAKSAVLNWLLAGLKSLHKNGLVIPDTVSSAVAEYKQESDMISRFAGERLEKDPSGLIKTSTLLQVFQEWAQANGFETLNSTALKGELERAGFTIERSRPKGEKNPTTLLKGYRISAQNSDTLNP
jgi:P4 family phage/plasmid primase-like protien